jgi:hypothetical protein
MVQWTYFRPQLIVCLFILEVDRLGFFNADTIIGRPKKADTNYSGDLKKSFFNNDNYNNTEWTLILT